MNTFENDTDAYFAEYGPLSALAPGALHRIYRKHRAGINADPWPFCGRICDCDYCDAARESRKLRAEMKRLAPF
jgi:hypothetical protein